MLRRLLAVSLLPALAAAQVPQAKVIERYKQLLAANPAEGTALDRLWQAYAVEGRTGELIAEFEAQHTHAGQMLLGLLLRKAGRDADAIAAFQRALTLDPKNPAPALALGRLELAAGHAAQAVIWFQTAADLLPADAQKTDALLQLGTAALAAADLTRATEAWEKTAALAPDDLALRQQLADTYVRSQLGPRAIPHLDVIVQLGSPQERAQALRQIGAIHQAAGDQDSAIAALEKALAITSPGNWLRADLESQLIRLHERYHRTAELEEKWKASAAENPRDLGACLQLIGFYERLGDQTQQLVWLEKLTALAPKNLEYRLRLARLLAQMNLLDRAAAAYDEMLGSEPRNIELVFERARIDVQRDQPDAAGDRIAALLARSGNDEGIRAKALDFYLLHRLHALAEAHLREDAAGADDALVALANFYFSQRREDDARSTLARLVRDTDPPEKRAAAHFRIAGEYKAQSDMAAATAAVRAAIDLGGEVRDYHFMLGELESGAGHYVAAETAFERAFALSRTPEEALDADQRLYDSLRNQREAGEAEPGVSIPRPDSAASVTSAAAQGYLLKLLRAAVEQPTEAAWLRVARWQQWSRNTRGAIDAAERALAINGDSIPAHDFLARLAAGDSQTLATAQQHLTELARIDSANRAAYLRRLGQLQVQAGQTSEAIETFQRIVRENPGDLDALQDLALARQRAGQWEESLAVLQQLHALSPAPRRHDATTALLRVHERLGHHQQAAELLLQQTDTLPDGDRAALFADLLAHCTKHNLLDWLRTQLEQRQKLRVGDYFTEVSLGRVLKAQGNKAAAFEVLSTAALSAPNPGEALPELVREAVELHRIEAAARLQERLVRVVPQDGPEGWLRLAELQERSLQPDAAAKTWARLTSRHPRDVQVLEKAAAFERVWGEPERAISLLRRIRAIDPANPRALAQLAELDLSDGDPAEAEQCLEQLLALSDPEKPGAAIVFPDVRPDDPSRLEISYRTAVRRRSGRPSSEALKALRTFWFEKPGAKAAPHDSRTRLDTIRNLAEIVAAKGDPAALAQWVARWQQPGTGASERLWALHFAGASGPLLDEVEKLIAAKPDDPSVVNAFIWLALRTGEFERLAAWNNDRRRTPSERDFLMIALQQYLEEHRGPIPPELVAKIFPAGQRANLWLAAGELAQRGHFQPAIQLGTRVLERLTTQRAEIAFELAQWQLQLGALDEAVRTLRGAIPGDYDTLHAAYHGTLRALHLLLPVSEHAGIAQECERTLDAVRRPVQAAFTRALLAGLGGDGKSARAHLDRLLELRPMLAATDERSTAATRRWDFILVTGAQFVNWQLHDLAAHLWERALADDASIALDVQQPIPEGDAVRARVLEVRTRATALKLMHGNPAQLDAVLDEYMRHAPPDGLLPLAETLEAFGANPVAVAIHRRLWAAEPANPHELRNALAACRNANDWAAAEDILTRVVTEGHFKKNAVAQRDLVTQLVEALMHRGKIEHAIEHTAVSIAGSPPDARALARFAELQLRAGRKAEAEETYRRAISLEPANATIRLGFAALLDADGRTAEAIANLERSTGSEIDARLAALNLKAGRTEEALAALERLPEADRPRTALAMADHFVTTGDAESARHVLRATLGRTRDVKLSFSLQSRLVELLPAEAGKTVALREARRLRQFAGNDTANYFSLMQREAPRLGIDGDLRDELIHAWDGARGDAGTGAAWLAWLTAREGRDAAAKAWNELAAHPQLDVPALQTVLDALAEKDSLRLAVLERLARVDAANPQRLVDWARAAHAAKDAARANSIAAELAARAVFNPELLPQAAELFTMLGDGTRARECYARAAAMDPTGLKAELHAAFARLLLAQRRYPETRSALQILSRNPAADAHALILEYLTASSHLDDYDAHLADFALDPAAWQKLRASVFAAQLDRSNVAAALRMIESSAALLDAAGAARLRSAARSARQFEGAVAAMENALAQGASHVAGSLAQLLADWAETELAALQVDDALAHLARAHQLQPAAWRVAERLARLLLERNEPRRAADVLHSFFAASTDAEERGKAQQMLARIPGA